MRNFHFLFIRNGVLPHPSVWPFHISQEIANDGQSLRKSPPRKVLGSSLTEYLQSPVKLAN